MSKIVETVPFNFDDIFEESRNLFSEVGFDVSDGSNTTQLCATLSYLIASLNTNTAMNVNETLLPYATKRKNILQDARVLGYEIKHKTSYQYKIKIRLSDKMCGCGSFRLPKYSYVSVNSKKYYYYGVVNDNNEYASSDLEIDLGYIKYINSKGEAKRIYASSDDLKFYDDNNEEVENKFKASKVFYDGKDITNLWEETKKIFEKNRVFEINVKEGELITYDQDVSSLTKTIDSISLNGKTYTRNFIDIPYNDVENDGIECFVSYYDEFGNFKNNELFSRTEDYFFERDGNENDFLSKKFLRLDDIEMNTPRIYFKYAEMGTGIPFGSTVKFTILITNSINGSMGDLDYETVKIDDEEYLSYSSLTFFKYLENGEYTNNFENFDNSISNVLDDCIILSVDLIQSGTESETNESIQQNAPKVYNSAYRLVTNLDYQSACNRSTFVKDSVVWGGEDEFPKSPGHIWFSFLPEKTSERSFTSNIDKTEFKRTNSELIYNYQEGESKYQYALRQKYYQKNYILNTEIKNYSIYKDHNNDTQVKYGGVWGDLINQYVPSLTFHHRHPIYLNFNYSFDILKYNIKQTTSEIHNTLFKVLDNCFYGSDTLNLENFNSEYFHTNLVKRIDYTLSDLCGFTSSLETQLVLNEKTCCSENWNTSYKDIYIPLCVPFEKYFDNLGFLDIERLPNIDTKNFIDFRFDDIVEPLDNYDSTEVKNKYTYLRYSIVQGDLFVDFSKIKDDQTLRKFYYNNPDLDLNKSDDYSDVSTKIFVAPIKIDMTYKYFCNKESLSNNNNYIQLGFNLAPNNNKESTLKNISIYVYSNKENNKYENDGDNSKRLKCVFTDIENDLDVPKYSFISNFNMNEDDRSQLVIFESAKKRLEVGDVLEIKFQRTCGYYYLFNSFKKEILVHLFVNGDFEGFKIAKTGMLSNEYYDHYLDEIKSTWKENEETYNDETMYVDITYTTPRCYLTTIDKQYLSRLEPTGKELVSEKDNENFDEDGLYEKEAHLFNYGEKYLQTDGNYAERPSTFNEQVKELLKQGLSDEEVRKQIKEIASDYDDRDDEISEDLKLAKGHYLTTEGYLSDGSDIDTYTGPVVREYNENMYLYTPLTLDLFRQNVYMNLKYNSLNFKLHRNVIPRLNNVKFKNAIEMY